METAHVNFSILHFLMWETLIAPAQNVWMPISKHSINSGKKRNKEKNKLRQLYIEEEVQELPQINKLEELVEIQEFKTKTLPRLVDSEVLIR